MMQHGKYYFKYLSSVVIQIQTTKADNGKIMKVLFIFSFLMEKCLMIDWFQEFATIQHHSAEEKA